MANKINIENYEAYLLDYMEGNLSKEDFALLQAFAALHPELDIDLSELELVELENESVKFEDKGSLKKSALHLLSDEDYINYIEKNISQEEKRKVDDLRVKHPEINKELSLYQKTILTADKTIVFENKETLKKKTKVIWLFSRQTLSMAAAITLIIGFIVVFRSFTGTTSENLYSSKLNDTVKSNNNVTVTDSKAETPDNKTQNSFTEEQAQQASLVASNHPEKKSTSKKNNSTKETAITNKSIAANTVTTALVTETTNTITIETSTITAVAKELVKPSNETKNNSTFIITEKAFDEDETALASNDRANFWQKAKKAVNGLNKIGVKSLNASDKKSENSEEYSLSVGNISIQKNKFIQE